MAHRHVSVAVEWISGCRQPPALDLQRLTLEDVLVDFMSVSVSSTSQMGSSDERGTPGGCLVTALDKVLQIDGLAVPNIADIIPNYVRS